MPAQHGGCAEQRIPLGQINGMDTVQERRDPLGKTSDGKGHGAMARVFQTNERLRNKDA